MKNVKEFYNEAPRLAVFSGLVAMTCFPFLIKGVSDLIAANAKFDEHHCKMVLSNHTSDNSGRTLRGWVPGEYNHEPQDVCPSTPAVCSDSCHDSGMAGLVVMLTFVGLSLSLASPWLQEGKKKVTNKLLELGFFSKKPEQTDLLSAARENASNGTFDRNQNV